MQHTVVRMGVGCVHVWICVCAREYKYVLQDELEYAQMHTPIHIYTRTCVCNARMHSRIFKFIDEFEKIHVYIYIYVYICIHIYIR